MPHVLWEFDVVYPREKFHGVSWGSEKRAMYHRTPGLGNTKTLVYVWGFVYVHGSL